MVLAPLFYYNEENAKIK